MERTFRLTALLLVLPLASPPAAADEAQDLLGAAGLCVDPEGPSVNYDRCGPSVGVIVTVTTESGTYSWRFGCQEDCARTIELKLCTMLDFPAVYDGDIQLVESLEERKRDAERDVMRMIATQPGRIADADVRMGPEPPEPCMPGLS